LLENSVLSDWNLELESLMGMKAGIELWIDHKGKAFGDGPYELLKKVEATGSLHKATAQMGISYSYAWKLTRMMEQRLGFKVLDRQVGGKLGGGSRITPKAKRLMSFYSAFREEAKGAVFRIFEEKFNSLGSSF